MESSIGGMADREWNPLSSAIYSTSIDQEPDFMAQLNNCSLPNTTSSNLGFCWCSHNESDANMILFEEWSMHSMYSFSQGSSYTYNSGVSPIYYNPNNSCHISANNNTVEAKNKNYFVEEEEEHFLNQDLSNVAPEDTADNLSEMNSKKRSLIPLHKNKRMVKAKKNDHEKPNYSTEGRHPVLHRQRSGSCLSEDDSNASNLKGASAAPNSNGKSRTSRSTATDPHSLYARKRREKINERLRILQKLLPNAAKVDISTMLEEAVQYVKFLQNQIKLLSSDDLWMYAPIA